MDCALRELEEELGLGASTRPGSCTAGSISPRDGRGSSSAYWPDLDLGTVRFGDEGQGWAAMPVAEFLDRPRAIAHFQGEVEGVYGGVNVFGEKLERPLVQITGAVQSFRE